MILLESFEYKNSINFIFSKLHTLIRLRNMLSNGLILYILSMCLITSILENKCLSN